MTDFKTGIPETGWDRQLLELGGHFLQSRAWASFQQALGRRLFYAQGNDWMWLAAERRGRGVKYLMAAYGPVVRGGGQDALASLRAAGRQAGADFVRLEPQGAGVLTAAQQFEDVNPSCTWVLDLTATEEGLRGGVSQSNRNLINTAAKRNLSFGPAEGAQAVEVFLAMLADTAKHAGIKNYPDNYYRTILSSLGSSGQAKLYLAKCGHQVVAGSIVYDFGPTRYYAHAAAFQDLNRQHKASVPLVWHLISQAKAEGKAEFDFWGVAESDDPDHPWAGITRFKKSFGGQAKTYAGTWDLPLKPAKYGLYRLAKRILPS